MRRFADTMTWADRGGFAIDAAVDERMAFIKRTYMHLLAMLGGVALAAAAVMQIPALMSLSMPVALIGLITIVFVVPRMLAPGASVTKQYMAASIVTVVYGFFMGPLAAVAIQQTGSAYILAEAGVLTGCVFVGLTAYVFTTRKDFSYLGGALTIGLFLVIGLAIVGMFMGGFGRPTNMLISAGIVILFSGFVLYDTSKILHHYPTNAHVFAATMLLIDVVVLFKHILILLLSSRD